MSEPQNSSYSGATLQGVYNNVAGLPEYVRTPNVWKTGANKTGANAPWTPSAGKKFRVLGGEISLSTDATTGGQTIISLQDAAATVFWAAQISLAALGAIGEPTFLPIILPANGFLSATANNVLNMNMTTLTAGDAAYTIWGTEE